MANRFVNYVNPTWTPQATGGTALHFTGLQSLQTDPGFSMLKGAGDNDPGPTTMLIDFTEPVVGFKLESVDQAAVDLISGSIGTFTVVIPKAGGAIGVGSGALSISITGLAISKAISGQYRKFHDCDIEIHGIWSYDVSGNPVKPLTAVRL